MMKGEFNLTDSSNIDYDWEKNISGKINISVDFKISDEVLTVICDAIEDTMCDKLCMAKCDNTYEIAVDIYDSVISALKEHKFNQVS